MPEIFKEHGEEFLKHIWELAKVSKSVITLSGTPVKVAATRAESAEAKNILKIDNHKSVAVVAVAFSLEGTFLKAATLLEKASEIYTIHIQHLPYWPAPDIEINPTVATRINWTEMNRLAVAWAMGLETI